MTFFTLARHLEAVDQRELDYWAHRERYARNHAVHCPCGRFAKDLGTRWRYNGNYNACFATTDCKRCGVQTVQLV